MYTSGVNLKSAAPHTPNILIEFSNFINPDLAKRKEKGKRNWFEIVGRAETFSRIAVKADMY